MSVKSTMTDRNPEALTDEALWSQAQAKLQQIIAEQAVTPLTSDDLRRMGDLWPDDESVDDFIKAVRQWRGEGRERMTP